ncbi:MAG: HAD family hydrolase [Myxococcota bacterium]
MALPSAESLRALLLDLDDTILDDRSGVRGAWQVVSRFTSSQVPELDETALLAAIAAATRWYWSDAERERRGRLDLTSARTAIVEAALAKLGRVDRPLAVEAARRYTEHRDRSYRLADGAVAALERLRSRFAHMALVTNGAADTQRGKIERFSLAGFFDHIQVEGEFGLGKPEARVYEHVMTVLRVEPGQCLMVGDNYRADVLGPLAVGMHAAWIDVDGRGRTPVEPPRPHGIVRSLAELADRLGC